MPQAGKNGNKYVPYEERTGEESVVYFTRNLSAEGLIKAYEQVCENIDGRVGVKLHTGEQNGPQHHSSRMGEGTVGEGFA